MRKLKIKRFFVRLAFFLSVIALPIFTFLLGVILTLVWQVFVSPPTVSLCQLAQSPYFYAWRTVRVEAEGHGGFGTIFIVDETCKLPKVAASGVWKAEGYEPDAEVQRLYSESDAETYKARILVTGRFDPEATPGCYVPEFAIRATSIELKSEVTIGQREKREE